LLIGIVYEKRRGDASSKSNWDAAVFLVQIHVQIYGKLGEEIWEIKRRFIKKMGGDKWVLVNNK